MLFSLVIPTFNNLSELKRCLGALEQVVGADFEVWVGVDGSTDGTREWLAEARYAYPLHTLYHADGGNHGRSATRNLALAHVRGDYVLFMDSDMEAAPDLLTQHLAVLAAGGTVSIGTVRYRNRARNLWVRYTSERGVAKYAHGEAVPFQYFITPNTALPAAFFKATGGFDEQIDRYGGEDMELGYRIQQQFAPQFRFNAQAVVTTTQPKTLEEALPQLQEYGATGLRYIVKKWPSLRRVYWVDRAGNPVLRLLTAAPGRAIARALLHVMPFFVQKFLVNYLVISYVHRGYRSGAF